MRERIEPCDCGCRPCDPTCRAIHEHHLNVAEYGNEIIDDLRAKLEAAAKDRDDALGARDSLHSFARVLEDSRDSAIAGRNKVVAERDAALAKVEDLEAKLLRFQLGQEIESDYLTRKDDEILRLMNKVEELRGLVRGLYERTACILRCDERRQWGTKDGDKPCDCGDCTLRQRIAAALGEGK